MLESQPQTSTLLRLPGELRNQIYESILIFSWPVVVYREAGDDGPREPATSLYSQLTALFLTCKQIHSEAGRLFYSRNKFALPAIACTAPHQVQINFLMRWFLDPIGPRNASAIQHLRVPFPLDQSTAIIRYIFDRPLPPMVETDEDDGNPDWKLIPFLQRRCSNLKTIELDIRGNNSWVRLLTGLNPRSLAPLFDRLDDALRTAFPSLRRITVCTNSGLESIFRTRDLDPDLLAPLLQLEWGPLRKILDKRGWDMTFTDACGEDSVCGSSTAGSSRGAPWGPKKPYPPPQTVVRRRLKYATKFLRSPRRVLRGWEIQEQWEGVAGFLVGCI
jgi:hypothetical protein